MNVPSDPRRLSRRQLLAAGGLGVVAMSALGPAFADRDAVTPAIPPGAPWLFGPYQYGSTNTSFIEDHLVPVSLPHCVVPLSWRDWSPETWERRWVYRRHFDVSPSTASGRLFAHFDAVMTTASVYLNGRPLGEHPGGYLPFSFELTGKTRSRDNVLAVIVDGGWRADVPPNRPRARRPSTIDFYQPSGMYRAAGFRQRPDTFIADVFARPANVLDTVRSVEVSVQLDSSDRVRAPAMVTVMVLDGTRALTETSAEVPALPRGLTRVPLTVQALPPLTLWDIDDPHLYTVRTVLTVDGMVMDQHDVRIGFRDAQFRKDGFFLNGRRRKLFGLNRHQWYPYVGAAMPDRVHRKDAEILKRELNCNMVRCSHYPQSEAFLDACDELGLMVWEEAPGWDYIGDATWRERVRRDVRGMIVRDRNHPSIIVWGTRLNETKDDAALYTRTNDIAVHLDGSRPTTGAVDRAPNDVGPVKTSPFGKAVDPYSTTEFTQNVFAYNDYSRRRKKNGLPSLRPPRIDLPYLISEAVGTLVGPAHYRRTDRPHVQSVQALLHAAVHDDAAGDDRYCGLLAWCAFDYPSGWYHALEGIKWPGVCDIFRIPKLGAAFYRSQIQPARRPVIEPGFYWDFGPRSPANGPGSDSLIYSNCDTLAVSVDGLAPVTLHPDRARFPHLAYPPFVADLAFHGHRPVELRVDGYLAGKRLLTRTFSADSSKDMLLMAADDTELDADGADATRLALRAVDRYGAARPYVSGHVTLSVRGPATLVGDNPFPFDATGGAGAVWLRTVGGHAGAITVRASHPRLGTASATVTSRAVPRE
ncbi:MAG: glycoside hydrolase family 2 protein [Sciscionella sp.]